MTRKHSRKPDGHPASVSRSRQSENELHRRQNTPVPEAHPSREWGAHAWPDNTAVSRVDIFSPRRGSMFPATDAARQWRSKAVRLGKSAERLTKRSQLGSGYLERRPRPK